MDHHGSRLGGPLGAIVWPWHAGLCLGLLVLVWGMAVAADRDLLLAGLVTKLPAFVDWPASSAKMPEFTLCMERGATLAKAFAALARYSRVDGRPFRLRALGPGDSMGDCRLLFLSSEAGIEAWLGQARGRSVLTVSTLDGAARRGVMVELGVGASGRPRFRINRAAVKASPIELSFRLLELAEIVQ